MVVYGLKYNILVPLVSCLPAACLLAGRAGMEAGQAWRHEI